MVGVAKVVCSYGRYGQVGVVMVGVPKVVCSDGRCSDGRCGQGSVAKVVWPWSRSAERLEEAEPLPRHLVELVDRHDSAHVGAARVREHAFVSIQP